jgi:D-alanyl-D-alanine carboxypeptidase
VANGPPTWSMHAYGEAIDVNTVQNPYFESGHSAQPPAGAAFADRADHRPGMAYPGGALVDAFAAIGWGWGGYWTSPGCCVGSAPFSSARDLAEVSAGTAHRPAAAPQWLRWSCCATNGRSSRSVGRGVSRLG